MVMGAQPTALVCRDLFRQFGDQASNVYVLNQLFITYIENRRKYAFPRKRRHAELAPVMYEAAGLARKSTPVATSSTRAGRLIGLLARRASIAAFTSGATACERHTPRAILYRRPGCKLAKFRNG